MKPYFCSNCGAQLTTVRKALPKLGTIIDLVNPHICLEEPVDPMQVIVQPLSPADSNKFVQSLNGLNPSPTNAPRKAFGGVGTDDLRDRRFESDTKSTAPSSVLDQIKQMTNSVPLNDFKDTDDAEMGG